MTVLLDPTYGAVGDPPPAIRAVPRPASLDGLTVGLLDISKPRGDVFLDRVGERLAGMGVEIKRFTKPTFTKPAPVDLRHEIATTCDAVIEALAD